MLMRKKWLTSPKQAAVNLSVPGVPQPKPQPRRPNNNIKDSIEAVLVDPDTKALKLAVETDVFGKVHMMYDSGASLNVIQTDYARRHFRSHIKPLRGFWCKTAGGDVVVREYISVQIVKEVADASKPSGLKRSTFHTKFYLIQNTPSPIVMSRHLFAHLEYKIALPNHKYRPLL